MCTLTVSHAVTPALHDYTHLKGRVKRLVCQTSSMVTALKLHADSLPVVSVEPLMHEAHGLMGKGKNDRPLLSLGALQTRRLGTSRNPMTEKPNWARGLHSHGKTEKSLDLRGKISSFTKSFTKETRTMAFPRLSRRCFPRFALP